MRDMCALIQEIGEMFPSALKVSSVSELLGKLYFS